MASVPAKVHERKSDIGTTAAQQMFLVLKFGSVRTAGTTG
jgi:hypothetical protein